MGVVRWSSAVEPDVVRNGLQGEFYQATTLETPGVSDLYCGLFSSSNRSFHSNPHRLMKVRVTMVAFVRILEPHVDNWMIWG